MCIKIVQENRDRSRFWELFRPTTNNFQLWLASSAFAFFAYQSLYEREVVGVWEMIMHQIIAYAFAVFGFVFMGGIVYLFLSWIIGFGIRRIKEKGRDDKPK